MQPNTRLIRIGLGLGLGLLLTSVPTRAQDAPTGDPPPAADASDVASVDAIIESVYASISAPAGVPRDWERFQSLFMPGARLMPTFGPSDGNYGRSVWTPEEYMERAGPSLERDGFFENEIHRIEERFGPVVHAFSTYESRRSADDPDPFARGINSFQLFWDGSRWWVVGVFWYGESEAHPIPATYLPGADQAR